MILLTAISLGGRHSKVGGLNPQVSNLSAQGSGQVQGHWCEVHGFSQLFSSSFDTCAFGSPRAINVKRILCLTAVHAYV